MLQICKSSTSAPVRILYQGMVMCRLASTVSAVSDMRCERRAVTEGSIPADRRGAMLTCRAVAPAYCGSARRSPPAAGYNYPSLTRAVL
jgi:hypothetical protein